MNKIVRAKTRDAAFSYRMGAAFPGVVNRTHPASIEPTLVDSAAPPTVYGEPVVAGTNNGVRKVAAGDTALTDVYGFLVRPYPIQEPSATNYGAIGFGNGTPPTTGAVDVLRTGYIMSTLNSGAGTPTKGGAVFVWIAATTTGHTQGGLETAASTGNTIALPNSTRFNGPADANNYVEIARTA